MISTDESAGRTVPGLLEVLAQVPDPRNIRGRRYLLTFVLAVAVACALAGARNFREAGDHAADLPQGVLARLGGIRHPLRRRITAPSETRIRTLIQAIGADLLDDLTGGWLRALADAGRLDEALTAIAIDGKWLRGVLDGQVKLFAAMLHDQKAIIGQGRLPDGTTEVTQVKELLRDVDLENTVVTADAAHSCRETAQYIAGKEDDGGREADYLASRFGPKRSIRCKLLRVRLLPRSKSGSSQSSSRTGSSQTCPGAMRRIWSTARRSSAFM